MVRRITAASLIVVAACSGGSQGLRLGFSSPNALSYAQYHSLEKGMRARSILEAFGKPLHTAEKEGKVYGLTYRCEDSTGQVRELKMIFGAGERLERWVLRGAEGAPAPKAETASGA